MTKPRADPPAPTAQSVPPPEDVRIFGVCGPDWRHLFPVLDAAGKPVLDGDGEPVHVELHRLLSSEKSQDQRQGVAIACRALCPVASSCLRWAVETGQSYGAYGGHIQRDVRAMIRARKAAKKRAAARVAAAREAAAREGQEQGKAATTAA